MWTRRKNGPLAAAEGGETPQGDGSRGVGRNESPEVGQVRTDVAWRQAGGIGYPVRGEDFSPLIRRRRLRLTRTRRDVLN